MRRILRSTALGLICFATSAIPTHGQDQDMLQVAYDSLSANYSRFTDVRLVPIHDDPGLLEWFETVSAIPAQRLQMGLSQKTTSFDETLSCDGRGTCLFRSGVRATVAFGEIRRTENSVTLGAVVRWHGGWDHPAPAAAWFEVHVYRKGDRTFATVQGVAES